MVALILLTENVGKLALSVFHFMSFINHNVFPVIFVKLKSVFKNEVVCGNANIPLSRLHNLQSIVSSICITFVYDFADGRRPFFELGHPVGYC